MLPDQAVELTLGVSDADLGDGNASFGQLGGDSLAAIQFAREVSELCGVSLPVSFVLDHSQSLRDIVNKARAPYLKASCCQICSHAPDCLFQPAPLNLLCPVTSCISFFAARAQVEQLVKGDESGAPTFAKIHHGDTDTIRAADLDLKKCATSPV